MQQKTLKTAFGRVCLNGCLPLNEKVLPLQNLCNQSINQCLLLSATQRIFQERKALCDQSHWYINIAKLSHALMNEMPGRTARSAKVWSSVDKQL